VAQARNTSLTEQGVRYAQMEADMKRQLRQEEQQLATYKAFSVAKSKEGVDLTEEEIKAVKRHQDAVAELTKAKFDQLETNYLLNESIIKQGESVQAGLVRAYRTFYENFNDQSKQAETMFNTLTKGFEDSIVKFVQTGKLSFKDLFNSLIAEATRIAANRLLMSIFGSLFGGGTGTVGFFSNLFGGFRAEGGAVSPNKAYVVGEKGPELFMPRSAGDIIPNGAAMAGGSSITQVTYNIQAVDASSFRTLVARDPEFIFQVTEQGRRSLPIRSRR